MAHSWAKKCTNLGLIYHVLPHVKILPRGIVASPQNLTRTKHMSFFAFHQALRVLCHAKCRLVKAGSLSGCLCKAIEDGRLVSASWKTAILPQPIRYPADLHSLPTTHTPTS